MNRRLKVTFKWFHQWIRLLVLLPCFWKILFSLIYKDLINTGVLFNGILSELFDQGGKIPRNFLSQIVNAGKEDLNHVQDVLINLEIAAMYADADAVVKIAEGRI